MVYKFKKHPNINFQGNAFENSSKLNMKTLVNQNNNKITKPGEGDWKRYKAAPANKKPFLGVGVTLRMPKIFYNVWL